MRKWGLGNDIKHASLRAPARTTSERKMTETPEQLMADHEAWVQRVRRRQSPPKSRKQKVQCGARTISTGNPCRAKALANGRCKNHGGMSTGPRTPEGKATSLANLKQYRNYLFDLIVVVCCYVLKTRGFLAFVMRRSGVRVTLSAPNESTGRNFLISSVLILGRGSKTGKL